MPLLAGVPQGPLPKPKSKNPAAPERPQGVENSKLTTRSAPELCSTASSNAVNTGARSSPLTGYTGPA